MQSEHSSMDDFIREMSGIQCLDITYDEQEREIVFDSGGDYVYAISCKATGGIGVGACFTVTTRDK